MGVAAMRVSEKRVEAITANLANVGTPAFKRQGVATQVFEIQRGRNKTRELGTHNSIDFSQGLVEPRDDAYSLALEGDGFFAVETPTGEAFTRNGRFRLDDRGELLTQEGLPVAWVGARGQIQPNSDPVTIETTGKVRQGANELGTLRIVDFADKHKLKLDEYGCFRARPDMEERASDAVVHQRAVERSNAQSVDEMVALIRAQRSYESGASILRSIDQSFRRLNQSN